MDNFTPTSLIDAIRRLFELNHFEVSGPIQMHGAEIDLVATPLSDPFSTPIYVEATVEYVDNDKYGKDVGKLAMISALLPGARKLIVSARGFTLPVKERAEATQISTLTYDELFSKFECFEKYISHFLGRSDESEELRILSDVYEEPDFEDAIGKERATEYLSNWRISKSEKKGWLIITGEYGTGKTALTKILLRRWLTDYKSNPRLPLPIRIELRDFSKQFDAKGLLHHFLDNNSLGHISIDYLFALIHSGRVVLILDGYDEMAQYLHARERRACLEALAELSADGAMGILTSRPNYFTETEEFQVFEILYSSLQHGKYYLDSDTKLLLDREKQIDELLGQFIDRHERTLRDLSPAQTESLIERILKDDPRGKAVVLSVLNRIFRFEDGHDSVSLSGKPVIVSYLLEVVEGLKGSDADSLDGSRLTEWQVYRLIIDQLMLRDLRRSPELNPDSRRHVLRTIAMFLSQRENAILDEQSFKDLISKEFRRELNRLPSESRTRQLDIYFADLRSSATLTRGISKSKEGWKFSHNSLREYLVAEYLLDGLRSGSVVTDYVLISDAMKSFAASLSAKDRETYMERLRILWQTSGSEKGRGQLLSLLWDGFLSLFSNEEDPSKACLSQITGSPIQLDNIQMARLCLSSESNPVDFGVANFSHSLLTDIIFHSANLQSSDFSHSTLDNVVFAYSNLENALFVESFIVDADFAGAKLKDANFRGITPSDISIFVESENELGRKRIDSFDALGYVNYHGALTDEVPQIYIIKNHPSFTIVDKIIEKLAESTFRQRRGLEQRGAARQNVPLAQRFLSHLEKCKLIHKPKRYRIELIEVTERGREVFNSYQKAQAVSEEIMSFFEEDRA